MRVASARIIVRRVTASMLKVLLVAWPLTTQAYTTVNPAAVDYGLSAQAITNVCDHTVDETQRRVDMLIRNSAKAPTFDTTLAPIENMLADMNDILAAEQLLGSVSEDVVVRDASDLCQNRITTFVEYLHDNPLLTEELTNIPPPILAPQKKLLQIWQDEARRSGSSVSPDKQREYGTLQQRIENLQRAYMANLSEIPVSISVTQKQLAGLSPDFIATLDRHWDGTYTVPVDESTDETFLTHAQDETARRSYYFAYANRGYPENTAILSETLAARLRLANLLGYQSWADYRLEDTSAGSGAAALDFLVHLDAQLLPQAKAEIAALITVQQGAGIASPRSVAPWNVLYDDEQLRTRLYHLNADTVRSYFPLNHTLEAIMQIASRLFAITFTPAHDSITWSKDVQQYNLYDTATQRLIGTLYLDLYPRPGKYPHSASFPILPARQLENGALRPPVDVIISNLPRPQGNSASLLSHEEIETLLHEFGHALATLLCSAPYETLSTGFRSDFVEAPAQLFENWGWDAGILHTLSAHVGDGTPMPDPLIHQIIASRQLDEAYFTTRQILYAAVDLHYHSNVPRSDPSATWATLQQRFTPLPYMPGSHPEAGFSHIMSGYDAQYYSYLWSQVYAQDLFTAFARAGLEDTATGLHFRQTILEPARTIEPDAAVQAFLGRPVSPAAFAQNLHVTNEVFSEHL